MQRGSYGPAPAHSPPLHHPVPQHVSTVPMMRSPPPPQSQGGSNYGSPYGQMASGSAQHGTTGGPGAPGMMGGQFGGAPFGGFMNDQTAQMGFQVGQKAVMAGQEYMEQSINRYVSIPALKHYFNVSTPYVLRKILLVLFPWRHKPWSREQRPSTDSQPSQATQYYFLPPRDDLNSPDMYIPVMAFVTYILLSTLLAGLRGAFHPQIMGLTASAAFAVIAVEILALKFGTYILSISNDSQLLDLVAYSGYKFVGVIVTLVVAEIVNGIRGGGGTGGWVGWGIFLYAFAANAFFLLRSLKYVLLPDSSTGGYNSSGQTIARSQRNRRTQFLFLYAYAVQFIFMWVLTRVDGGKAVPGQGARGVLAGGIKGVGGTGNTGALPAI